MIQHVIYVYECVIPTCRLNISIHAVHFASNKLWNTLNTNLKLITNIMLKIKKIVYL